MKTKLILALFLVAALPVFAQSNKFTKNDFGIRYGIYFNGSVSQELTLMGMVTDKIEIGSIIGVSYNRAQSETTDSSDVNALSGLLRAQQVRTTKYEQLTVGISPYFAYHFPLQSNLDIYLGVYTGLNVTGNLRNVNTAEYKATDYSLKKTTVSNEPLRFTVRGGVMVGCQYFFYKNVAFGAQASLGAGYFTRKGNLGSAVTVAANGSEVPATTSMNRNEVGNVNENGFALNTIGSVGLNLTFYFSRKPIVAKA